MRTDAIIDRKQVRCPNASTLGYGKWKAQVGDLVEFKEGNKVVVGRMVGRISYAPNLNGGKPLKNYIVAICIDQMLRYTFERWINPIDVTRVERLRNQTDTVAYFLGTDIAKAPVDEVCKAASDGWSTLDKYRKYRMEREEMAADFDRRHPKGTCQCDLCNMDSHNQPR